VCFWAIKTLHLRIYYLEIKKNKRQPLYFSCAELRVLFMKQFSTSLYFYICLILMIHNDARLTGLLLFYVLAAYMLSWYNDHNAQIRLLQTQLTLKSHCCDTTIQCNTNDWFIQKTSRIMVNFTYCHSLNTKPICRDTHNNHCYLVSTHISPSIFVNSTNNKRHIIWCICHNNNIYTV